MSGQDDGGKANALAAKLREVLGDRPGVRIVRLMKTAELRLTGFDDTANEQEMASALARARDCPESELKIEIIRRAPSGLASMCARCPLAAANKIITAGRVRMG